MGTTKLSAIFYYYSVKTYDSLAAPNKVDEGYEKASSSNLPIVTIQMLADFFNRTTMYVNNESSGVKAQRSLGSNYGDEAIGRVQLKKAINSCSVVADVTAERKIKLQPYKVVVNVDVRNSKIKSAECKGYVAALGFKTRYSFGWAAA